MILWKELLQLTHILRDLLKALIEKMVVLGEIGSRYQD